MHKEKGFHHEKHGMWMKDFHEKRGHGPGHGHGGHGGRGRGFGHHAFGLGFGDHRHGHHRHHHGGPEFGINENKRGHHGHSKGHFWAAGMKHSRGGGRHHGKHGGKHGKGPKGLHFHPFMMHHHHRHHHHNDKMGFTPAIDIFSTPAQTIIHASLPGAKKTDLSIGYNVSESTLRLAGVVHRPGVDEEMYRALVVSERGYQVGEFEREVPLPLGVVVEGIQARLEDGILTVFVPRVEEKKKEQEKENEDDLVVVEDNGEGEMKKGEEKIFTPEGSDE
ncbi:hypothetical protein ASPWEDRAFT_40130, partial [Aspergillus wentii DTO 134E9]